MLMMRPPSAIKKLRAPIGARSVIKNRQQERGQTDGAPLLFTARRGLLRLCHHFAIVELFNSFLAGLKSE